MRAAGHGAVTLQLPMQAATRISVMHLLAAKLVKCNSSCRLSSSAVWKTDSVSLRDVLAAFSLPNSALAYSALGAVPQAEGATEAVLHATCENAQL